ncbi:MAG: hypothetical protein LIO38_02350, partial [Cloacibacillus sp.]|nr:hypothetical protein [Cloacibacillus sp.]
FIKAIMEYWIFYSTYINGSSSDYKVIRKNFIHNKWQKTKMPPTGFTGCLMFIKRPDEFVLIGHLTHESWRKM